MSKQMDEYEKNADIAVRALFPHLDAQAVDAIVFLLVDFLSSLDAIYKAIPE